MNSKLTFLCAALPLYLRGAGPVPERIDAHVQKFQASPVYAAMLERLSMRVLNICFDPQDWAPPVVDPAMMQAYVSGQARAAVQEPAGELKTAAQVYA